MDRYRALQLGEHEFYLRVIVADHVSDEAIHAALERAPAEVYVVPQPPQEAVEELARLEDALAGRHMAVTRDALRRAREAKGALRKIDALLEEDIPAGVFRVRIEEMVADALAIAERAVGQ